MTIELSRKVLDELVRKLGGEEIDTELSYNFGYGTDWFPVSYLKKLRTGNEYTVYELISEPKVIKLKNPYSTDRFHHRIYIGLLEGNTREAIFLASPNPLYNQEGIESLFVDGTFQPYAIAMIVYDSLSTKPPHIHVGGVLHFSETIEGKLIKDGDRRIRMLIISMLLTFARLGLLGYKIELPLELKRDLIKGLFYGKLSKDFTFNFHRKVVSKYGVLFGTQLYDACLLNRRYSPYKDFRRAGATSTQNMRMERYEGVLQDFI